MGEDSSAAEQEARVMRLRQNVDALRIAVEIIADMTLFTVGPGETDDYEHTDLERRYVEMAVFYYWWVANLILDASDYEWKDDFTEFVAKVLARDYPGIQAVLPARWLEYEGPDPTASMASKAAVAAQRVLRHIDPDVPVPKEFAGQIAIEGTRVATEQFRKQTAWI